MNGAYTGGVRQARRELVAAAIATTLLVATAATASGHATSGPSPAAPSSQSFPEFGACPAASPSRYLPKDAGCVTVRRADITGNGSSDVVILFGRLNAKRIPTSFTLEVIEAGGSVLTANVPQPDLNPTIALIRNVNGRPGAEIFVHEGHVTTEEEMGVYAFDGRGLRRAGGLSYGGEDAGIRFGFTCRTSTPAQIVEHEFLEQTPFKGVWKRRDTTFRWVGARLVRGASRTTVAKPAPAEVGVHC